jgi:two-component system, chemotaxis family, protein-glutamate methylesterase/glutaminase
MEKNDLNHITRCVLIGGSAGSLKSLMRIIPALREDIDFPIIIILHRKNDRKSSLDQLLSHQTRLTVKEAEDKDLMEKGAVYIAPPNYHLLIEKDGTLALDGSEKVQWSRPSIDVSFESAADIFGINTFGIILSGANNDGTYGLECIKLAGGQTLVQHPDNAEISTMPLFALERVVPNFVCNDDEIAGIINQF